ncbi:S9 family peptidase [Bacillus sp. V5-8f]|uniref:alpha/beta hydrolase family protein n=1 Tax=Bacillus sp. V5-8f TaxID=2053044 RepID=UPI000C786443|nr:alpha/beta fold hydrolase [Bacillus sp. V5-8f]PLT32117.1 alpha/beta hydrolase [Bacillus sp. V5-8f]
MEKEVSVNGPMPIYGTIAIPEGGGKYPAILIIPGSGPIDRDGNDRKGKYMTNLYKDLADYFKGLGFVAFRFDKRGTGKSEGEMLVTGLSDLVGDAYRSFEFLRSHPNVDQENIIVCGHSEGTIIATALAERTNPAGIMLLSGGVDNLMEALKKQRQLAYQELFTLPGFKGWINRKLKIDEKNEKKYDKLMRKIIKSETDIVRVQFFFKQPAKWFREHSSYNTREALKNVSCPVFALHGDKDPLVDNEVLHDLPRLVEGESEFHIIQNMEHGLRYQTKPKSILQHKKLFKEALKQPLNAEALTKVSAWLLSNYKTEDSRSNE